MTRLTRLRKLQDEQRPWAAHNFGNMPSWQPLLGVVEELGELVEADVLEDRVKVKDAVADTVIYLADYCSREGFDFQTIVDRQDDNMACTMGLLLVSAGALCHAHLAARGESP